MCKFFFLQYLGERGPEGAVKCVLTLHAFKQCPFFLKFTLITYPRMMLYKKLKRSGKRDVINHRGWIPVGVQMVVCLRVIRRCPDLVQ